jgi:cytidyltransferase-like protein
MKYKLVVCGGTFDHLHKGHKSFLKQMLELSDEILLGLTTDEFVAKKNRDQVFESYEIRKNTLLEFFEKESAKEKVRIEPIDDNYIPQQWHTLPIEAIVVSQDSKRGAEEINIQRAAKNLPQLLVEIIPMVYSEDNQIVSSSRIRTGQINRDGRLYIKPEWKEKNLFLPDELRDELKKPLGELITNPKQWLSEQSVTEIPHAITVGDVITRWFNDNSLSQSLSIIDFVVERQVKYNNIKELGFTQGLTVVDVESPPAIITGLLIKNIIDAFSEIKQGKKIIIIIDGEEDLAVLPCLLVAPLGWNIFYGQPGSGFVHITVTEEEKEKAYNIASKFTVE